MTLVAVCHTFGRDSQQALPTTVMVFPWYTQVEKTKSDNLHGHADYKKKGEFMHLISIVVLVIKFPLLSLLNGSNHVPPI